MRALVIDKLAKPLVRDPGPEPTLEWLSVDKLVIDPEYQRDVKSEGRRAIERIAARFEWTKFSAVVVSPVSLGRFAIIDGQHRATAAKLCGHQRVPCLVQALDRAGQAASFAAINGSVTKITPMVIYKAALAAGEGWAVQAKRVADAAGCKLMTSNKSSADKRGGEIFGVNTMRDLIARHGEATVTAALKAFKLSVYGDLPIAWSNTILLAWVTAVASDKRASTLSAKHLAAFHDEFDVLEVEDVVSADGRAARRNGETPPAHWAALSAAIAEGLKTYQTSEKTGAKP